MEYRICHVSRNLFKHNRELDDLIFGCPYPKQSIDWPLTNPAKYLADLTAELHHIDDLIDTMKYIMREKQFAFKHVTISPVSAENADTYVFHHLDVRQFGYAEKLYQQIETLSMEPREIEIVESKAIRQMNVLIAAKLDLQVTITRFTAYEARQDEFAERIKKIEKQISK